VSTRTLILIYALSSAALYSALMPPWEGFDELYHYAYVQHLATTGQFPVIGKTALSRELWISLDYFPVSHYLQPYLERPSTSFDEYFRLTPEQRFMLRRGADNLDPAWRREPSPRVTYEAKQAPLTYLLLAPLEAALSRGTLATRVLLLRTFLSLLSIALLWAGARCLAACLGLQGPLDAAFLLAAFSCQMLYAETCRVANDALAAPWLAWFLVAVIGLFSAPTWKRTTQAALLLAAGLLIKSSLLVFLPLAFAAPLALFLRHKWSLSGAVKHSALSAAIIAALAGPWYLRNLQLYSNLTATDETSGMGLSEFFHAAAALPWRDSIAGMLHSALWTGNNSFVTFSHATLDLLLAFLAAALVLYSLRARRTFAESVTIAAIVLYIALLLLITLAFFRSSAGQVDAAMPWYAPVLLVPILALAFAGFLRWNAAGRWLGLATVALWTYVAAVSWIAKLVPLYGGFEATRGRPAQLAAWYLHSAAQRDSVLSTLCPAPLAMIYLLLAVVLTTIVAAAARVFISLARTSRPSPAAKPPVAMPPNLLLS
jgi:hypothetical protein